LPGSVECLPGSMPLTQCYCHVTRSEISNDALRVAVQLQQPNTCRPLVTSVTDPTPPVKSLRTTDALQAAPETAMPHAEAIASRRANDDVRCCCCCCIPGVQRPELAHASRDNHASCTVTSETNLPLYPKHHAARCSLTA
jgi:hypothetical protein